MGKDRNECATPAPRRVLLIQTAFVGDVIFMSPLVHAIKAAWPECTLAMLVQPSRAEVAACIPGVDEVLAFDKRGRDSGPFGLLRAAARLRRGKFDLLFATHRSARTALLAGLSRIPVRIGYRLGMGKMCFTRAIQPKKAEPSRLMQDLELLRAAGVEAVDHRLRLKVPAKQSSYVEAFYRSNALPREAKLVGLCIGSVWPTKRWPTVYFASLVESLRSRAYHPVLFGGPDEVPIACEIEDMVRERHSKFEAPAAPGNGPPLLSCVGNSLSESSALLEKCEMAVGGDSGLTHMARALGVPTALIYGPTDPRQHQFGEHVRVLTARVRCRPCSRHGHNRCPERHHDCMRLVSPEQVLDAFRDIADLQTPIPPEAREAAGQFDDRALPLGQA